MILPFADVNYTEAVWVMVVKSIVIFIGVFLVVPILTVAERKLIGRFQGRYGPNRVGPYGLLQPLADVGKLLGKQPFRPTANTPSVKYVRVLIFPFWPPGEYYVDNVRLYEVKE